MAAANGPAPQHLEFLRNAASVVRRHGLYGLLRAAEARAHGLPKIGDSKLPAQNIVDLAQVPILAFPATTLESITVSGDRAKVEGYWFGLTGPMGPLPLHLTEFAHYERRYSKTRPFGAFLDLLAGRMLQFFYRAWADSNPAASADRPATDRFAGYLAALTGAADGVRPGAAFPVGARLYYAGLYASRRSAAGLQDAIADLAGAPVTLVEYVPLLRDIEPGGPDTARPRLQRAGRRRRGRTADRHGVRRLPRGGPDRRFSRIRGLHAGGAEVRHSCGSSGLFRPVAP